MYLYLPTGRIRIYIPAEVSTEHQCEEWADLDVLKSALEKTMKFRNKLWKFENDDDKVRKNPPVQHRKDTVPSI